MLDIFDNQTAMAALVIFSIIIALIKLPDGIGNSVKKALGGLWIIVAVYALFSIYKAGLVPSGKDTVGKMWASQAATIQWSIILTIFTLVLIGFAIFGYYGLTGAYDNSDQD